MKIVALIGALAVVAHASVYVSPTGDDTTGTGTKDRPYRTVRYAHDKIDTTGVIYLMPGAYTGSENMFELQKSLTISGAPGEDPATIWFDGLNVNNGPIFTFSIVKGVRLLLFLSSVAVFFFRIILMSSRFCFTFAHLCFASTRSTNPDFI